MKASMQPLLSVIGRPDVVYETPLFQRVYSWTERQCSDLWDDIMKSGENHTEHFMGTMLYGLDQGADQAPLRYNLIDGQQRAVTMTLLLAALRERLQNDDALELPATENSLREPCAGECAYSQSLLSVDALASTYLIAPDGSCKLRISNADEPTLTMLVQQGEAALERAAAEAEKTKTADDGESLSPLIVSNERFFAGKIASLSPAEFATLIDGLGELMVVAAELEEGDQPQLVFETLNSRGMSLSTFDLIRNLLLARYNYDEQAKLFERYWQPTQELFFDDEERLYEDAAVYAWLKTQVPDLKIGARSELYQAFKAYVMNQESLDVASLLQELSEFCRTFMKNLNTPRTKDAVDWALGRLQGLVSERHLFGY